MTMTMVLESSGEEIVLYFEIESEGLDAQTFGNALLSFDALYRSINAVVNPGIEVEIEFLRSDQGSIRAILKSFRKDTKTLLQSPFLHLIYPFLLGLLVNQLTATDVKIIVNDDSYIVDTGTKQTVLPRAAKEKAEKVERDPSVRRSVRNFFTVVDGDQNVKSVDFRLPEAPQEPVVPIERPKFASLRDLPEISEPDLPKEKEEMFQRQIVVVVTAVLEKSRRKWQFLWNGQKIWADIQDESFFEKLTLHEYEFGQGDTLLVDLIADQELNEFVKAYETKGYHISKVHSHSKGPKQTSML